jgi:hypothetical protein
VRKTARGVTTHFVYDENGNCWASAVGPAGARGGAGIGLVGRQHQVPPTPRRFIHAGSRSALTPPLGMTRSPGLARGGSMKIEDSGRYET